MPIAHSGTSLENRDEQKSEILFSYRSSYRKSFQKAFRADSRYFER